MTQNKSIETSAEKLQEFEDSGGKQDLEHMKQLALSIQEIYYPVRDVSTYAKIRPFRTLIQSFRRYKILDEKERKFMMQAELVPILSNPPQGIKSSPFDIENRAGKIVLEFIEMIDYMFAGAPMLAMKYENSLANAYLLALSLTRDRAMVNGITIRILYGTISDDDRKKDIEKITNLLREIGDNNFIKSVNEKLSIKNIKIEV